MGAWATVHKLEIPPVDDDGMCSDDCPFYSCDEQGSWCIFDWEKPLGLWEQKPKAECPGPGAYEILRYGGA